MVSIRGLGCTLQDAIHSERAAYIKLLAANNSKFLSGGVPYRERDRVASVGRLGAQVPSIMSLVKRLYVSAASVRKCAAQEDKTMPIPKPHESEVSTSNVTRVGVDRIKRATSSGSSI